MAIIISQEPQVYEPVYTNLIPFKYASSFAGAQDFKYISNLFINNQFVDRNAGFPRPNGTGLYSPHYILQSNITTKFVPQIVNLDRNDTSYVSYRVRTAEQYNPGLTFSNVLNTSGFLGLTFSSIITGQLFVNDIITIQMDNISINPQYNSTASVTSIVNNRHIQTDIIFATASATQSGRIINIYRDSATSSNLLAWNASRQAEEWNENFRDNYILGYTFSNDFNYFLSAYTQSIVNNPDTNMPFYKNDWGTLDCFYRQDSFATFSRAWVTYLYYDNSGSVIGTFSTGIVAAGELRYTVPVGPRNIIDGNITGFSLLVSGSSSNYGVFMSVGNSSPDIRISKTYHFTIIPECETPYEKIRLAFLNKLGGFDYWTFDLKQRWRSNIERTQIDRAYTENSLDIDGANILQRGKDVIYSKASENWRLSTQHLSDDFALYIRELVESSDVYMYDNEYNVWFPVVITDSEWTYKSGLNDGFVNYEISLVKSNDRIINR
jgi:hypothetical protein